MLNQVVLVGRLTKNPEVIQTDSGPKRSIINIAVSRSFKNSAGLYESDFFNCILWNGIAENTCEYCKKGDIVGVKGRLQSSEYDDENGKRHFVTEVIAEKVTFLSSKTKEEEE